MNILYAGDSPAGGPANYLLGILKHSRAKVSHFPPGESLPEQIANRKFDAFIFSDFSHKDLSLDLERALCRQIVDGAGLLMVGGWGSFSGPLGGWGGSQVESLLPVACANQDDRLNFPQGAFCRKVADHAILQNLDWSGGPAILGINQVTVKKEGKILLELQPVQRKGSRCSLSPQTFPLLVIQTNDSLRSAALTTDVAPHWCGGLVDWGEKPIRLAVNERIHIEVGNYYVRFVKQLIDWVAGK